MNNSDIIKFIQNLVVDAVNLKNKYVHLHDISINYACIFTHSDEEYKILNKLGYKMGSVVRETTMGSIFHIEPIDTIAGQMQLLKIRKPDPKKFERGYVDFTVPDYNSFKNKYLPSKEFHLIKRPDYEILGLSEKDCDVRVYFAYPPMDEQLGVK